VSPERFTAEEREQLARLHSKVRCHPMLPPGLLTAEEWWQLDRLFAKALYCLTLTPLAPPAQAAELDLTSVRQLKACASAFEPLAPAGPEPAPATLCGLPVYFTCGNPEHRHTTADSARPCLALPACEPEAPGSWVRAMDRLMGVADAPEATPEPFTLTAKTWCPGVAAAAGPDVGWLRVPDLTPAALAEFEAAQAKLYAGFESPATAETPPADEDTAARPRTWRDLPGML
jgi:hypothetical protein